MRYPSIFKTPHNIPLEDCRLDNDKGVSWSVFAEVHKDVLAVYEVVVNEILSTKSISLETLSKNLMIRGYPRHLIQMFLQFITCYLLKRIKFVEHDNYTRTPEISLVPDETYSHIRPSGSYSVWKPK